MKYVLRVALESGAWAVQLSGDTLQRITPNAERLPVCSCGAGGCQHLAAVVAHIERSNRHEASATDLEASYGLAQCEAPRPVAAAKPQGKPGRCPHYTLIRSFYALAVERGLDTKADGRIRAAFSAFFGFTVWSRGDLTAIHWELAKAGLKSGALAW